MNSSNMNPQPSVVEVQSDHRWSIYHRLQDLGIPCWCAAYQPLRVQLDSAIAVVQFWQVCRQVSTPHHELITWLEACWQQPLDPLDRR